MIVFETPLEMKGILDNESLFLIINRVQIHHKTFLK